MARKKRVWYPGGDLSCNEQRKQEIRQLIEDEVYFLEVSRYIHLNPVKALMVRGPLDYKYSSYGSFFEDGKTEGIEGIRVNPENLIKGMVETFC